MAVSLSIFAVAAIKINPSIKVELLTWALSIMAVVKLKGRNYLWLAKFCSLPLEAVGLSGYWG